MKRIVTLTGAALSVALTAGSAVAGPTLAQICEEATTPIGHFRACVTVDPGDPQACIYLQADGSGSWRVVTKDDSWDCWWCSLMLARISPTATADSLQHTVGSAMTGEPPPCPPPFRSRS